MSKLQIQERPIRVDEYQLLRSETGWAILPDAVVEKALLQDLFSVCIIDDAKIIGMARVIGDGAIYFYIQDVIVAASCRGQGIGGLLMERVEQYLEKNAPQNSFVGLMAASGVQGFYKRYGYLERPEDRPGMYKVIDVKM